MGLKYLVGRTADEIADVAYRLARPASALLPTGRRWPLDVRKLYVLHGQNVGTIFDVGANIGQTAMYLQKWFPAAHILSFEPVRETYTKLRENVRNHRKIEALNLALGARQERLQIPLMENSELNTLTNSSDLAHARTGVVQEVEVTTIDAICMNRRIQNIDILKMDVQGFELEVLNGARESICGTRFIYAECSLQGSPADMTQFCVLHPYLAERGFFFCGLYECFRHWHGKLLVSFANALYLNTNWRKR